MAKLYFFVIILRRNLGEKIIKGTLFSKLDGKYKTARAK